ncbi:MAG TPA: zf-HC2 domain-containing protein [Terriglobia bacterium]|jgi:hypothetical protein|nr:zf-HC2 domain-containing protein [Terriglobia bacterium]
MNCSSFEELIALHAEGDLDSSRAASVELHLKSCTSCQRFLAELKASQALVKDLAEESLDAASFNIVRQRVMQEVNRRQETRVWWRLLPPALAEWRPAWAAALVALVALGLLLQWQLWHKPGQSDRVNAPRVGATPDVRKDGPADFAANPREKTGPEQASGREPATRQIAKRQMRMAPHAPPSLTGSQTQVVPIEDELPLEQGSNLEPEQPTPADVPAEPPPPLVIKLVTDDPNIVIVWLVDQEVQSN